MKKIFYLLITILILIGITSCKNFMNGSDLIQEIDEILADANAPEVEVLISSDGNFGTTAPNGKNWYKVNKPYSIIFTASNEYMFEYWEAVDRDTNASVGDAVNFIDKYNIETQFIIAQEKNNILIRPKCFQRPNVDSFFPSEESENPKDTTISITLKKDLSPDIDLSGIEILCNGDSVSSCYKKPVVNGNVITIAPDMTNLLNIPENTYKKITVIVPSTLYYEENGQKVYMNTQKSWSFKVNSTTTIKSDITFGVSQDKGSIFPLGNQKYSIGEKIRLEYIANPGYKFYGWNILDSDGHSVVPEVLYLEDDSSKTTLTILQEIKGVSIEPKVELIPIVQEERTIPAFNNTGVPLYKTIKIMFNTPIKAESFDSNFKNISIKTDGHNIEDKFSSPVLSSDGMQLTIKPNAAKLLTCFAQNSTLDITVTVSKNIKSTQASESGLESDYVWTYRINKDFSFSDVVKPTFDEIKVSKIDKDSKKTEISDSDYSGWGDDLYKLNHVNNKVYIYCKGIDSDSGIKYLKIVEKLLYSPSGVYVNKTIDNPSSDYDYFTEIETGVFSSEFEYEFCSQEDGLIELECTLYDYAGLPSDSKKIYAVKDTFISSDFGLSTSTPGASTSGEGSKPLRGVDIDASKATISVNVPGSFWADGHKSEYILKYSYGYSLNSLSELNQITEPIKDDVTSFELTGIDPKENTIIKLYAEDEVGNSTEFTTYIPKALNIVDCIYKESSSRHYYLPLVENQDTMSGIEDTELRYHFYYKNANDGEEHYAANYIGVNGQNDKYEVGVYYYVTKNNCSVYGACGEIYVSDGTVNDTIFSPSFIYACNTPYDGKLRITLTSTFQRDVKYFFSYLEKVDGNPVIHALPFSDENKTVTIPFPQNTVCTNCKVGAAIKNKCLYSDPQNITINSNRDITSPELVFNGFLTIDARVPNSTLKNSFSYDGNYFITLGYKDDGSGIEEGNIDGKSYTKVTTWLWNDSSETSWTEDGSRASQNEEAILTEKKKSKPSVLEQKAFKSYNTIDSNNKMNYSYSPIFTEDSFFNFAIPIKDIEDDKKTALYCIYTDKAGNKTQSDMISWYGSVKTIKKNPEVTIDGESMTISIEELNRGSEYDYYVIIQKIISLDESEKNYEWFTCRAPETKKDPSTTSTDITKLSYSSNKYIKTLSMNELSSTPTNNCKAAFTNAFVKVNVIATKMKIINTSNQTGQWKDAFRTVDPEFSYSTYIYTDSDSKKRICKSKNYQFNNGKLQISHDKPCFVQTVCSAKNRGTDINEWERRGEKLNKQYYNELTYALSDYEPRLNDIPANDYYCYIIHFADGSSIMTDVYRK